MVGRRILSGCILIALTCGTAQATSRQVLDLHYGEALFHYFQDNWFTAMTRLGAAQQRQQLPHHEQDAAVLMAGMELSWGMPRKAEQNLQGLLETHVSDATRQHVWYHLARIAWHRNNPQHALRWLEKLDLEQVPALDSRARVLQANVLMALSDNTAATSILEQADDSDDAWLLINQGIAQLRAGDIEAGRDTLQQLDELDIRDATTLALQDRANLGLGLQLLQQGQPQQARQHFDRVRLEGPSAAAALLAAGWADLALEKPADAITPWLTATRNYPFSLEAQEAFLALGEALDQTQDRGRGIHIYEQALTQFDQESARISKARYTLQQQGAEGLLQDARVQTGSGWHVANPLIQNIEGQAWYSDLFSGHEFQQSLKHWRDLHFMTARLQAWEQNLDALTDVIATREQQLADLEPAARQLLESDQANQLQEQAQALQQLLAQARAEQDNWALSTDRERQLRDRLQDFLSRINALPNDEQANAFRERAAVLSGVLDWQVSQSFIIRAHETDRALQQLAPALGQAQATQERLQSLLAQQPLDNQQTLQRIADLRKRLKHLLPRTDQQRQQQATDLVALMQRQLDERQQHLQAWQARARYALARHYDQLADASQTSEVVQPTRQPATVQPPPAKPLHPAAQQTVIQVYSIEEFLRQAGGDR